MGDLPDMKERHLRGLTDGLPTIDQSLLTSSYKSRDKLTSLFSNIYHELFQENAGLWCRSRRPHQKLQSKRHALRSCQADSEPEVRSFLLRLTDCMISFGKQNDNYCINFLGQKGEEFQLPIHLNMNAVVFVINRNGKPQSCFEWQLEKETEHVGCYMDPENKNEFR